MELSYTLTFDRTGYTKHGEKFDKGTHKVDYETYKRLFPYSQEATYENLRIEMPVGDGLSLNFDYFVDKPQEEVKMEPEAAQADEVEVGDDTTESYGFSYAPVSKKRKKGK